MIHYGVSKTALLALWRYRINRTKHVALLGLTGGIVMALIVTAFVFFRTPVGRQVLGV